MFESLGHTLVKYRKIDVALFVIGILRAGAIGSLIFNRLDSGGYSNPKSDSYKVYEYLRDELKVQDPAVVVVVDETDKLVGAVARVVAATPVDAGPAPTILTARK